MVKVPTRLIYVTVIIDLTAIRDGTGDALDRCRRRIQLATCGHADETLIHVLNHVFREFAISEATNGPELTGGAYENRTDERVAHDYYSFT